MHISISKNPNPKECNIPWQRRELNIAEFKHLVMDGHAYNAIYNTKSEFKERDATKDNWLYTHVISVDFDYYRHTLDETLEMAEFEPNFAYNTKSNGIHEKNGKPHRYTNYFRFVYCFNEPITTEEDFRTIYQRLTSCFKSYEHKDIDTCGGVVTQLMYGFTRKEGNRFEQIGSLDLYSIRDFGIEPKAVKEIELFDGIEEADGYDIFDKEFIEDARDTNVNVFTKYKNIYERVMCSKIDFDDELYHVFDKSKEFEIRVRKHRVKDADEYGNVVSKVENIKFKDGERRHEVLYKNCLARRKMKPDITPTELLYNLILDRMELIDNSDGKFTLRYLQSMVASAIKVKNISDNIGQIKRRITVNRDEAKRRGISIAKAVGIARKEMTDKQIADNFNPELTNKENAANCGVSLLRLKQWKKEQGIEKKKFSIPDTWIDAYYDRTKSVKENLEILKGKRFKISMRRLYNYCKKYGINTKGEAVVEYKEIESEVLATEEPIIPYGGDVICFIPLSVHSNCIRRYGT